MPIIEVTNLNKHFRTFSRREGISGSLRDLFHRQYKTLKAVDNISFQVEEGELLGYIGPNGAGKSTSIKMLTGILKPSSGQIKVLDCDPFIDRRRYTAQIGVVFGQRTQLWWDIAVIESLRLLARIYRLREDDFQRRLGFLNETLELKELLHTPVRKLSLGQRMRCDLAAALIYSPKILFLDEPTIGLDAVGKDSVRSFLRRINQELKTTIIITTHDLKEIEELCQRIMIIDKGHVVYDGSLERIKRISGLGKNITLDFLAEPQALAFFETFAPKLELKREGERRVIAEYDPKQQSTVDLIRDITGRFELADFTVSDPDIEQIIMKIYREGNSAA